MRASALVLLALGGALAFSSAPAEPRDSRTSFSGTLPPCADGNYLDCTDSPAMLIGGHSADAGDYSEVDTSLDGSYLDQGKRCVDGTWYQYSNCMTNGGEYYDATDDILMDAFCAKHGASRKYKGPLPDNCCAQEKDASGAYPENDPCFKP